jgi:hypothetical protein
MPAGVLIAGTEDFRRTAAKLRAAGRGDLTKKLTRGMRAAGRDAVEDAQRAVKAVHSEGVRGGGGQARAAFAVGRSRKPTERVRRGAFRRRGLRDTTARTVRIEAVASPHAGRVVIKSDPKRMPRDQRTLPGHLDSGKWRKPVFGNKKVWRGQTATPPGWFSKTVPPHGPRIREAGDRVMQDVLDELAR